MPKITKICAMSTAYIISIVCAGCANTNYIEEPVPRETFAWENPDNVVKPVEHRPEQNQVSNGKLSVEHQKDTTYFMTSKNGDKIMLQCSVLDNVEISSKEKSVIIKGYNPKNKQEEEIILEICDKNQIENYLKENVPVEWESCHGTDYQIFHYYNEEKDKKIDIGWFTGTNTGSIIHGNDWILNAMNIVTLYSPDQEKDYIPEFLEQKDAFNKQYDNEYLNNQCEKISKELELKWEEDLSGTINIQDIYSLNTYQDGNKITIEGIVNNNKAKGIFNFVTQEELEYYLNKKRPLKVMMRSNINNQYIAELSDPDEIPTNKNTYYVVWEKGSPIGYVVLVEYGDVFDISSGGLNSHIKLNIEKNEEIELPELFINNEFNMFEMEEVKEADEINISENLFDLEFALDGVKYNLKEIENYQPFEENSWKLREKHIAKYSKNSSDNYDIDFGFYSYNWNSNIDKADFARMCLQSRRYGIDSNSPWINISYSKDKEAWICSLKPELIQINALTFQKNAIDKFEKTEDTPEIQMPKNIKIGSTFDDVVNAYGDKYETEENSNLKIINYQNEDSNVWFAFIEDELQAIAMSHNTEITPIWEFPEKK